VTEPAPRASRLAPLASAASLLAVVSCYATLGIVGLLSVVGVTIHLNEVLMARILTVVLAVALPGMLHSCWRHRDIKPFLLGMASAALLLWVFYGRYSRLLEAVGFLGLASASVWDFRARHRVCPLGPKGMGGSSACP
jgi:arsenite methyltransferase